MEKTWEPKDFLSKVEDSLLECGVCAEIPYDNGLDYHNLPCQHPLCEECVREIKQRDPEQKLKCPTCREVYKNDLQLNSFRFSSELNELRIEHKLEKEQAMQTYQENRRSDDGSRVAKTETYTNIMNLDIREQLGQIQGMCLGEWKIYIVATEKTGFFCVDLLTRQELRKVGHPGSNYSPSMVFNEGYLYVYNEPEQHIEMYKNVEFVYKVSAVLENLPVYTEVNKLLSLQPFPNGVLVSHSITVHRCRRDVFSIIKCDTKHPMLVRTEFSDNSRMDREMLVGRYLYRNKVLCVYRESLWFVDKRDTHLMEIPFSFVYDCAHAVHFEEPIRHFKIPHYVAGCGFGNTILCMTQRSDKVQSYDLTRLPPLAGLRIQWNKVQYTHAQTPVPVSLFDGPAAGCRSMTASENGQLTIKDKEGLLHIYQTSTDKVTVTKVDKCEQAIYSPEYVTVTKYQKVKEFIWFTLLPYRILYRWSHYLTIPLGWILLGLIMHHALYSISQMSFPYEYLSDLYARGCHSGHSGMNTPYSIGFKYFHLSVCLESPVLEPTTPCVFEDVGIYRNQRVNVIYLDGPKCFNTNVSNNLRTVVDFEGGIIGFQAEPT